MKRGYSSSSRAYETIPGQLGMTPSAFRRHGQGMEIRCTVISTDLGKLLIATTPRGICSVRFGESEAALLRELKLDFEAAEIHRDDAGLEPLATQVKQLLKGSSAPVNIPLDLRGTRSSKLSGRTATHTIGPDTQLYGTGETIGRPKAVRAVANACGSNPVAVVVPCHRVVQKNGSLAGYRWGVKRKAALLEKEAASR